MTQTLATGDRVVVRRTNTRNGKSDVMTGVILDAGDPDMGRPIHFDWDAMGRVHLALPAELAKIGCTQTITVTRRAQDPS